MSDEDQSLSEAVTDLFLLYMTQYHVWMDPMQGAVSPALSEWFRYCDPEQPALVQWARWLRIDHESNDGGYTLSQAEAETVVEAMIDSLLAESRNDVLVEGMRRAVRDPSYGVRDPNQLDLF